LKFRNDKGGSSSAKRTGRLYPRRNPWYSLSEVELTSGHMVLSGVPRKKSSLTSPGIDPGSSRLVAQCLNHYATPGPNLTTNRQNSGIHKTLPVFSSIVSLFFFSLNCCSVSVNMTRERSPMAQPLSAPLSAAALLLSIVISYVLFGSSSQCIHVPTATTMRWPVL